MVSSLEMQIKNHAFCYKNIRFHVHTHACTVHVCDCQCDCVILCASVCVTGTSKILSYLHIVFSETENS